MAISILLALIFAIISPFVWGIMSTLDKYVLSHRVRNPLSFAAVAGLVNLGIGLILAMFLDWSGATLSNMLAPVLTGILLGSQFFFYYKILQKEDVSHMIGLVFVYPLIVTFLSFLFLNERISFIGYVGVVLILCGAVTLSLRLKKIKLKASIWAIIMLISITSVYEFLIKVATINLPALNGIALNIIFAGLTVLLVLLHKGTREGFAYELRNLRWALLNESFTFLGVLTLYFAMSGLKATVVSSVAAIEPLAVLLFERMLHKRVGKMTRDTSLLPKLVSILLIVAGLVILYSQEILGFL